MNTREYAWARVSETDKETTYVACEQYILWLHQKRAEGWREEKHSLLIKVKADKSKAELGVGTYLRGKYENAL